TSDSVIRPSSSPLRGVATRVRPPHPARLEGSSSPLRGGATRGAARRAAWRAGVLIAPARGGNAGCTAAARRSAARPPRTGEGAQHVVRALRPRWVLVLIAPARGRNFRCASVRRRSDPGPHRPCEGSQHVHPHHPEPGHHLVLIAPARGRNSSWSRTYASNAT